MTAAHDRALKAAMLLALLALALVFAEAVSAHCDALDGPVVTDARLALDRNAPAVVLKWVKPEHEAEAQQALRRTLAVRGKGREARELAERWFFETIVRLHRAGEGEPFTGLKPAGSADPGLVAADAALQSGTVAELAAGLGAAVAEALAQRHAAVLERRAHMNDGVAAGRAYVEAYVEYAHFLEAAHRLGAHGAPTGHGAEGP
jgi:hypothetical protein